MVEAMSDYDLCGDSFRVRRDTDQRSSYHVWEVGIGFLTPTFRWPNRLYPQNGKRKFGEQQTQESLTNRLSQKRTTNYYKPHWMHGVFLDGMNDDDIEELLLQEISNWDEGISSSKWYISNSSNLSQQAFSFSLALMSWRLPRIPPKVPCNSS